MPRLLIHFARYGPYHHARLRAAHEVLAPLGWEVMGLEIAGNDATYAWDESKPSDDAPRVITAFPDRVHEEITAAECRNGLPPLLDSLAPDAIAIAGWASPDALACLSWCRKHDIRRIVMSETREADGKRVWWKEIIKRYLISRFDSALVGGKSHRDYLVKLGMKPARIAFGYNVVDNAFFEEKARNYKTQDYKTQDAREERRREGSEVGVQESEVGIIGPGTKNEGPGTLPFFLASNRFIERKNLLRLVEAYAAYVESFQGSVFSFQDGETKSTVPWGLCLLGDGEQKPALLAKCRDLGLEVVDSASSDASSLKPENLNLKTHPHGVVWMPGFRQIDELPRFYAHAGCFIHPALEEPWGLVINEAMACGLPILSSNNVGAAEELVDDGVNGWKFDATLVEEITKCLKRISDLKPSHLAAYGDASMMMLSKRADTSLFGLGLASVLSTLK